MPRIASLSPHELRGCTLRVTLTTLLRLRLESRQIRADSGRSYEGCCESENLECRRARLHLRIACKTVSAPSDRIAFLRKNGRQTGISSKWAVEISGITSSHIIAMSLLVLAIAFAAASLLALILAGLHLCPPSLATELFRQCAIGGLSSGLITVLRGHRSRR